MRADVVLLKLHCRPNDLDCWVEALGGSAGWLSISLPPLYAGGESVLLHWMSDAPGGQAQKCNPVWCTKHQRILKEVQLFTEDSQIQIASLRGLNYLAKHNNRKIFLSIFEQLKVPKALLLL